MLIDAHLQESGLTAEDYLAWRDARAGEANPTRMTNRLWTELVQWGASAYEARRYYEGPSAYGERPGWSFQRFGKSHTVLPDGRAIDVAGEHEDFYDPDFFIYNDVIVTHPDRRIDIYGYPQTVFPPTDFHSATLVDDRLVLIGNLGRVGERRHGQTQVLMLDLTTYAMTPIETTGLPPGWIHKHRAQLSPDARSIVVSGGLVERAAKGNLVENIDEWSLDLVDRRWTRLTEHRWRRWHFSRQDKKWPNAHEGVIGHPDVYRPSIPHSVSPGSGDISTSEGDAEFSVFRIEVQEVVVRYRERQHLVELTIEGELAPGIPETLRDDLLANLRARDPGEWQVETIDAL